MKIKVFTSLLLSIFTALSLFSCGGYVPHDDEISVVLSGCDFPIFFEGLDDGAVTLADGREYRNGELLPVFSALADALSVDFEVREDGDIIFGDVTELARSGVEGELLPLSEYLYLMPSLSAYLEENPLLRLSVSADEQGEFFVIPYLSGATYATPTFNAELVRWLLDGEGEFVTESEAVIAEALYTPHMPPEGSVTVSIMKDGAVSELTKSYTLYGNIIDFMNYEIKNGGLSANDAVNMLRTYVDDMYSGFFGDRRSELFLGESAAWDADELVALLRCAAALGRGGLFVLDSKGLVGLSGMLFSVPWLMADDGFYLDGEGNIADARCDAESYGALLSMKALIDEGLVTADSASACVTLGCAENLPDGFITALPPVSGRNGEYSRKTALMPLISSRGVAVSVAVADDERRLFAVLRLIDYLFSDEGERLLRGGTSAFVCEHDGELLPSDAARLDALKYAGGDYAFFKRHYIGAGVLFPYGDTQKARDSLVSYAISLGTVEIMGSVTDDGIYFPPTDIRIYNKEEYALCDSSPFCCNYLDVFEKVVSGEIIVNAASDADLLIYEIKSDLSHGEYLELRRAEYERRLRCYKRICK